MSSINILLAEDNKGALTAIKELLFSAGCHADTAATGNEALTRFTDKQYSLVILKMNLPDMSGYEVAEKMRLHEKNNQQPAAFIAGLATIGQTQDSRRGIAAGMNEIVSDPITSMSLQDILQRADRQLPIIDLNLGAKILSSDTAAAKSMIDELIKMLPGDLERLNSAYREGDNIKLQDLAHYIKGGASYCGTPRLKLAATDLEKVLNKRDAVPVIQNAYEHLCHEIHLLLVEYTQNEAIMSFGETE